jgi:hypothetical protein
MALPPGVVVNGWNEVQAYIEWMNLAGDVPGGRFLPAVLPFSNMER